MLPVYVHKHCIHVLLTHRCICGLLNNCLVILITHQVQFALQVSNILALKEVHKLNTMAIHSDFMAIHSTGSYRGVWQPCRTGGNGS